MMNKTAERIADALEDILDQLEIIAQNTTPAAPEDSNDSEPAGT